MGRSVDTRRFMLAVCDLLMGQRDLFLCLSSVCLQRLIINNDIINKILSIYLYKKVTNHTQQNETSEQDVMKLSKPPVKDIINNLLPQIMVHGTFVLSVFAVKREDQRRRVSYRQTSMRYLVVLIAIFVVFGCQYCFDNASALQEPIEHNLQQAGKGISQSEFNLLYSLYAFPNVIIPLLGGIMIDKYGARIVVIITSVFCLIGHIIFGLGGLNNTFFLMLIGRIVFGIGGEVLHASQNTLISNWFKASELSMVLGICLSFPKMGSSLNSYVSPLLAEHFTNPDDYLNVAAPIFLGAILMCVSLILAFVLAYIDRKSQKEQKIHHQTEILTNSKAPSNINITPKVNTRSMRNNEVKIVQTQSIIPNEHQGVQGGQHINIKDICKLPASFWLIIVISMLSQALFIPFLDNGNSYYIKVFGVTSSEAGVYLILPYCISSLFVVIFGYLVQKVQKRSYVLVGCCFFYTLTYIFMMFTQATASMRQSQILRWFPSILLGICIAIFCSIIVPTVPMLVSPKLLGTGFGIMQMLQNLALGIFPLVSGFLRESAAPNDSRGFHLQTLFFFVISCICSGVSLILKAIDVTSGRKLDVKDFRKQYIKKILSEQYKSQR